METMIPRESLIPRTVKLRLPTWHSRSMTQRIWLGVSCLALLGLVTCATALQLDAQNNLQIPLSQGVSPIKAGESTYDANCSACHGANGKGGRAPRLADSDDIREMKDQEIFAVIQDGIPGTEMTGFPLSKTQISELTAFIRNLNASAYQQNVSGDFAAGEHLFYGAAGCSSCHIIAGKGGLIGPDLSNIGAERSVAQLTEAIRNPGATPRYRHVRALTHSGQIVDGVMKNDSTYSIQILDLRGIYHLLLKSDLQEIVYYKESLMPPSTLPEKDFQKLLAYLSRQVVQMGANPRKEPEERIY